MATTKTKTTKKATTKKSVPAKAAPKKMSGLDAAAKLLAELKQPLTAKEIAETCNARGWCSLKGATPGQTIYAAMIREIAKKGGEARFQKHDRGRFVASGTATAKPAAKTAGKKAPAKQPAAKKATTKKATTPADGTPGPKAVSDIYKI